MQQQADTDQYQAPGKARAVFASQQGDPAQNHQTDQALQYQHVGLPVPPAHHRSVATAQPPVAKRWPGGGSTARRGPAQSVRQPLAPLVQILLCTGDTATTDLGGNHRAEAPVPDHAGVYALQGAAVGIAVFGVAAGLAIDQDARLSLGHSKLWGVELREVADDDRSILFGIKLRW
jgi:hypothetical protein